MAKSWKVRLAGLLLLMAFGLYGGGTALIAQNAAPLGLVLILANSIAVAAIGLLLYPALSQLALPVAQIYRAGRLIEAVLLAIGAVLVVFALPGQGQPFYQIAMIVLGLSSLGLCTLLRGRGRVFGWLGLVGLIGYQLLIAAMIADLLGAGPWVVWLLIPSMLFEFAFGAALVSSGRLGPELQTPTPAAAAPSQEP